MRIALFSDIHGNSVALDAVLTNIEAKGGVDAYWILGDFVAVGPDPIGVMERLLGLPSAVFTRGNTDRYVVTGERPAPTPGQVRNDPDLLELYQEVTNCFAWTQGALAVSGYLEWLAALPLEYRFTLPDGTKFLGVHASPGYDDSDGVRPASTESDLRNLMQGCAADLVCVGHTHSARDVTVDDVRIVNLGSVSNPHPPDLRASYVVLETDSSGYKLAHHSVDYDHAAVIAECERVKHPSTGFITRYMLGQHKPPWV